MMPDPPKDSSATDMPESAPPKPVIPVLAYATPGRFQQGIWRWGYFVIVSHATDLPDRCVNCNGPTVRRIAWRTWRPSEIRNPDRRPTPLHLGMCRRHALRLMAMRLGFGLTFLGLGAIALSARPPWARGNIDAGWILPGVQCGLCVIAAVYSFVRLMPWSISRRGRGTLWIRFTGVRFRNSLPPAGK